MRSFAFTLLSLVAFLTTARAGDLPFEVYNPRDAKAAISEDVHHLIAHFREPRDGGFILATGNKDTLKWRVEWMNIISPDIVAVMFTEGHIDVIGIFERNVKTPSWDLISQIHGTFTIRTFPDATAKAKAD